MKLFRSSHTRVALLSFVCGLSLGVTAITVGSGTRGADRFSDVERDSYFDEAVGEMAEIGVIRGRPDGRFDPSAFATRAEIAVMMKRLRDEIKGITLTSAGRAPRNPVVDSSTTTKETDIEASGPIGAPKNSAGSIRFTIDHFSVAENVGTATITVIRAGGAKGPVSVEYLIRADTATANDDFLLTQGELQFADGETNRQFSVRIVDDTIDEDDETLLLVLQNPTRGSELGVPKEATLTIEDNDGDTTTTTTTTSGGKDTMTLSFSSLGYSVGESQSSILITVNRSGNMNGSASVAYRTADDTARSASDYTQASGTLSFGPNETSKTFTVAIVNDSSTEGNEKVTLSLSDPTGGAVLGSPSTVSLTIVDDEVVAFGTGSLRFTKSNYTVLESAGKVVIGIERVGGAKGTVAVDYVTINGTAKAGSDYEAVDATMVFLAGEAHKTFTVTILDDDLNDPAETLQLSLSNPTNGATLGSPETAVLTIQQ